jgi:pimeloyl-ACP methyl ester carboxylesterase
MHSLIEFEGHGGLRLAGEIRGHEGPTVLLLHGGGQTRHSWAATALTLVQHGFRAATVDLRGHGDSDWAPDGDYSLGAFARDLRNVVEALGGDVRLVGASLGGLSSILLLGEIAPELGRALVLVDVVPVINQAGADRIKEFMTDRVADGFVSLEEAAAAVAAYNPHRPPPRDLRGLAKNLRERDGRWYWHWDPAFMNTERGANELHDADRMRAAGCAVDVPMLLVRGRLSDLVTEADAQRFLADVPRCEFVDVSGAGHMVAGDRNDVFTAAVVSFLDRVG